MKNISFDNPYLLLLIIPLALVVLISFILIRNKDNRSFPWTLSLILHILIIGLVTLSAAGLASVSVLTKTTVWVVADVSYSSEQNLDKIDGYIAEIKESLPENSSLGVICFGKGCVIVTPAGRQLKSVREANLDNTSTDIVKALEFAEKQFKGDTIRRIVLITDGNDTTGASTGSIAATVERLTENNIKVDAIFLDNTLPESATEVQLMEVDFSSTAYAGHSNEAKFLIRSAGSTEVMLELWARPLTKDNSAEFERINYTVVTAEPGLATVRLPLPTETAGEWEYQATLVCEGDLSPHNNTRVFVQTVSDRLKILLISGSNEDRNAIEYLYGNNADIDSYVVSGSGSSVPFRLEEIITYDEILLSNFDIRNVRNANAFIDSVDIAVSQYGKSLITLGDMRLQTNTEDRVFEKLGELLPVEYGSTNRDGRLYTIVLDVSHSMFMASKFTIAKQSAIKLLSIIGDEDYVCLVTFSGEIKVKAPKKAKECRQELVTYIEGLSTDHGTDIGMGLEEALKTVKALNLSENQIMLISDGFSFESERDAVEVSRELYDQGATVSAINAYIPADGNNGRTTMQQIVNAGKGGNYYSISIPERVNDVVFGQMADNVSNVVIEKDSAVNIVKYKDGIINGMTSVPTVSGYIISLEKYDATVPLTLTYVKPNGYQETVPLYAYRAHGNGRVVSLTTSLTGSWTKHWSAEDKEQFVRNLFVSNTPPVRIEQPFTVTLQHTEYEAYLELLPAVLNPDATVDIRITYPGGRSIKRTLAFDSQKYFYTLETPQTGTYRFDITYAYGEQKYETTVSFYMPYLPEYNAFAVFDKYNVYEFMRGRGSVVADGIPSLENNKNEVTTYRRSYSVPLLIAAIVLFVADIFLRKLKVTKRPGRTRNKRERRNA